MSDTATLERLQVLNDQLDRSLPPEAMLRLLVDMTLDGLCVTRDGVIVYCSQAFSQAFGYVDDELLNQPIEVLVPEANREIHRQHVAAYLKRPRSLRMNYRQPIMGRRRDGSVFNIEVGLSPLVSTGGTQDILVAIRVPDDDSALHGPQASA